jgi:hypothetical protein
VASLEAQVASLHCELTNMAEAHSEDKNAWLATTEQLETARSEV